VNEWLERQCSIVQFIVLVLLPIVPTILVPLAVELWG
jgi:hypothetical protein